MTLFRMLRLAAATSACALLLLAEGAAARQPDCPCWADTTLLAMVSQLIAQRGPVDSCDQTPIELSHRKKLSQVATIIGPGYQIEAAQEIGSVSPADMTCTVFIGELGIVEPLKKNEFWRCAEDIVKLCRDLGVPPIE